MKSLMTACFVFLFVSGFGQTAKKDLTKEFSSAERKEILEALKLVLQPNLNLKPKMVVKQLTVKAGFAYFAGQAKDENGKDIDFRKTSYKEALKEGMFDGDATNALLKKTGAKWKVLVYSLGPTDVPYGCWWKEYKAPKDIFDYAEDNCDWVEKK